MSDTSWLSDVELAEATHRKQPSAQARVLSGWGVPFRRRPDGTLLVGRAALETAKRPPARQVEGPSPDFTPDGGMQPAWEESALGRWQQENTGFEAVDAITPDEALAVRAAWSRHIREKRVALIRFHEAKRRAAALQRTPLWADHKAIRAVYMEARRLTRETGVPHHVDHEIPLQGKLVSGLHVENNLQILTASENSRKRNKYEVEA